MVTLTYRKQAQLICFTTCTNSASHLLSKNHLFRVVRVYFIIVINVRATVFAFIKKATSRYVKRNIIFSTKIKMDKVRALGDITLRAIVDLSGSNLRAFCAFDCEYFSLLNSACPCHKFLR